MKNLLKKSLSSGIMLLLILNMQLLNAQNDKIIFEDLSWEEALKRAVKQNKAVFVDVGGPKGNCKPCEEVESTVFARPEVAIFHNSNFVNIKVNMHTDAGKAFAPNLQMLMYPVYAYFSAEGEQLGSVRSHQILESPDDFIEVHGKQVLGQDSIRKSNKRSIDFEELGWVEAKEKAKVENKLIFLDAYTTWCRPCIQMDRNVFTLNEVADFYNSNFVNVKMEMEKDEFGPELAEKYGIKAYPTYLFLDHTGEVVFEGSGYTEAEPFIKYGKEALKKYGIPEAQGSIDPVINFENSDWETIKAKARAENKLIFFDAYAVWCGPCKVMDRDVFTKEEVAGFFNEKFINAKFDMEKGEGINLKEQFNVTAYPTYMFINADEEVVHQIVGSMAAEKFLNHAGTALSDDNLMSLQNRYQSGNREAGFIKKYLKALQAANYGNEVGKVAQEFLSTQPKKNLSDPGNWRIFHDYIRKPMTKEFSHLVKNRQKFGELYTKDSVEAKIYQTYLYHAYSYISYNKESKTSSIDEKAFDNYLKNLKKSGFERNVELTALAKINTSKSVRNWPAFISAMDQAIERDLLATHPNKSLVLRDNANFAYNFCPEPLVWESATSWIVKAIEIGDLSGEQLAAYQEIHAKLLEKRGDEVGAEKIRADINQEDLEESKAKSPMKALIKQD